LEQLQTAVKIAPDHPEIHLSLKEAYKLEGKISEAVEECLELARIYERNQKPDQRCEILKEALALDPGNTQVKSLLDPSAAQSSLKGKPQAASERSQSRRSIGDQISMSQSKGNISLGPKGSTSRVPAKEKARSAPSQSQHSESEHISVGENIPHGDRSLGSQALSSEEAQEVEERFAEAEFYLQQGLKQEAKQLYQKVLSLKPSHFQAQARLSELELEQSGRVGRSEPAEPVKTAPPSPQPKGPKLQVPAHEEGEVNLTEMFMEDLEDKAKPGAAEPERPSTVDPAQQELESLFREFKKGIQAQYGDQDFETRYNLGIAYKEMGLLNEAIEEFKLASKGQDLFIDAIHMIAVCYKEEGEYAQAAQQLLSALKDERCSGGHAIGLKYELAQLYELMDRKKEALELFTEIYDTDQSFKDVAQKLKDLKTEVAPDMVQAGTTARHTLEHAPKEKAGKKKKVSYL
jgi:tetratricopeptide (TPR) repeat protein